MSEIRKWCCAPDGLPDCDKMAAFMDRFCPYCCRCGASHMESVAQIPAMTSSFRF
jgi:hypothetical protein